MPGFTEKLWQNFATLLNSSPLKFVCNRNPVTLSVPKLLRM